MTAPDAAHLWRVQLALECKAFNARGRLVQTPCPDPDELHDCYVVRFSDGETKIVFAESAPDAFTRRSAEIPLDQYFEDAGDPFDPAWAVQRSRFHTYYFATAPLVAGAAGIEQRGAEHFAAVIDGTVVAEAMSSRSDEHAAELWVFTEAAQQRRGYATQVAAAWAQGVLDSGKVAFYSHLHDNAASRSLARHLQVVPLFEVVALSL